MIKKGFRTKLETSDLWLLRKEETMAYNREIFTRPFEVAYREWRANLLADATNAKETRDMGAANGQADLELSEMKNGSEPTGAENAATDGLADGEATTNQKMGGKKKGDGEEEHTLEKLAEKPIPPLIPLLFKIYGRQLLWPHFLFLLYAFALFSSPIIMWYADHVHCTNC